MATKKLILFGLIFIGLCSFVSIAQDIPQIKEPNFYNTPSYAVVRIIDGDTIVINNGKDQTIRLVGIDTSEITPGRPAADSANTAVLFLSNLLKGERVYLLPDSKSGKTDKYSRLLCYVYRAPDGLFVNAEVIRQGYGRFYPDYPFDYSREFGELQAFAKKAQKGIWFSQAPGDESALLVYITKTGTKYHLKGCPSLARSAIPISLKEAKLKYQPCKICNPPQ